jgi:hypothetical protein
MCFDLGLPGATLPGIASEKQTFADYIEHSTIKVTVYLIALDQIASCNSGDAIIGDRPQINPVTQ